MDDRDRVTEARGHELLGLVVGYLPQEFEVTGDADAWPLVATAFVGRMAGTLRSILRLLPDLAEADAGTLLRTLYEHAVQFAWLGSEPSTERIRRWRKTDLESRLKLDTDAAERGIEIMSAEERAEMKKQIAGIDGDPLPPTTVLAEQADAHWEGKLPGLGPHREIKSLRGFYTLIFRRNSGFAHPSFWGLNPVVEDLGPTRRRVRLEGPYEGSGPYGMATLVFGFALYLAAELLDWPETSEVGAIFQRHPS